ncbi:MAG TPA: phage tail sheath C-terminal domain-containing protein [Verrucomicrobiae bacterium]|jgi:phage tail sheath protein FI
MPDYLSPGVYIEELPPQMRAIEGVSTSIAGFVGPAERGPAPGFPLPFTPLPTDPQTVVLTQTPTPALITSFSDFTRQFGNPLPLPDPEDNAYLGYAVHGFFSNGGQICYVSRVIHYDPADLGASASYGMLRLGQGTVLSLASDVAVNAGTITFTALRGIANGTLLSFFHKDGLPVMNGANQLTAAVQTYNTTTAAVNLTVGIAVALSASDVYAVPGGTLGAQGPVIWASNPGAWSSNLTVSVTPSKRRAVSVTLAGAATATSVQVQSTSGFYIGAIIEIDHGTQLTYHVVSSIAANGILDLEAPLGVAVATTNFVRIVEIDISIVDPTPAVAVIEKFTQLTWNPDPNPAVRARHYSTIINAQSQLAWVEPPGVGLPMGQTSGNLSGSEDATLASQPVTFNGFPLSITAAINALNPDSTNAQQALTTLGQAATALQAAVVAMAAGVLPLGNADPLVVTVQNAETALTDAATAATNVQTQASGVLASALAQVPAITAAAAAAVTAATAAVTDATTNPQNAATAAALAADSASVGTNVNTITSDLAPIIADLQSLVAFGSDGNDPDDDDYIGVDNGPNHRSGIQSLQDAENISIIAAPGRTAQVVQDELINQCELRGDRFAVLDGEEDPPGESVNGILNHRDAYDTSYAGYYVPWVEITLNSQNLHLPPSGHMAGIYAGTDNSRGVWKAPANVVVQDITGLKAYLVTGEQDILNPAGVNAIRRFDTLGTRVWGARTLSSDTDVMYINVRRTLIFLERSIALGTQWVVFEPNTPDTWDRLSDSVSAFLTTQWRDGALFGLKPEDSFYVRCDETTMSADDIQNGRLICQIGVAIVRPAEFVIFRIQQITGFANS